jgi:dihydropyrimidine dehydrogenase (NAD+) subunit PreT
MQPRRLIADGDRLIGVELEYTEESDGKLLGRGEVLEIPCDQLFKAIGQALEVKDVASQEP